MVTAAPVAVLGATTPHTATAAGPAPTVTARLWEPPTDLEPLDAALDQRRTKPVRLVFLGSSTTQGLGASDPARAYAAQVVSRLSLVKPTYGVADSTVALGAAPTASKGIEGFNGGQGGTWVGNYLSDAALQSIAATRPACVFHMIGSNDSVLGVSPATYESYLRANLARIDRAVDTPVCHVLVHTFRRDGVAPEVWAEFGTALDRIDASHPRAFAVDASRVFARRGVPGADPFGLLAADGVHPSDAGHALLARVAVGRVAKRLALTR